MMSNEHASRVFQCMSPSTEIRWGERMAVDLPVRVVPRGAAPVAGRLRNISISGALIAIEAKLAVCTAVTVTVTPATAGAEMEFEAVIVRLDDGAVGIEWRDMACQPLLDLLQQPRSG
jgi:hypothetical protein